MDPEQKEQGMAIFKRILFPVDLSEASKKIVPYVKEIMGRFGAELHVVRATNIAQYYVAAYAGEARPTIIEEEEKNTRKFIETQFENIPISLKILSGPPGPEIVEYAGANKMDLIIMGHSSTGIKRAIFGSVAGYVAKHSPVPVLIISPSILENRI
jgi:nucleotide-binding universal stress UspA family protein